MQMHVLWGLLCKKKGHAVHVSALLAPTNNAFVSLQLEAMFGLGDQ